MHKYDPLQAPVPAQWLDMDEGERIRLVEKYHKQDRIRMPNVRAHALFHTAVENQIAEGGDIPVAETLGRLMQEGLDRHDAVHAVASVLAKHMHRLLTKGAGSPEDVNETYFANLRELTAEAWRQSGE